MHGRGGVVEGEATVLQKSSIASIYPTSRSVLPGRAKKCFLTTYLPSGLNLIFFFSINNAKNFIKEQPNR